MNILSLISAGYILLLVLVEKGCIATTHSAKTRSLQEQYLRQYGYLPSSNQNRELASIQSGSSDAFTSAIREFQRMVGIRVTGSMNADTIRMMELPRCGVHDHVDTRKKRYVLEGSKWNKFNLTYKIQNFTTDMPQYKISSEIAKAFQFWSNVSGLNFRRTYYLPADIDIKFVSGRHADLQHFDGLGGTLAHAFFPQFGGDIHFDDGELWTSENRSGTNLLQVAIHEIGHSLGLGHSKVSTSIMAPTYQGFRSDVALHSDDIAAIRLLYGANNNQNSTLPRRN